MRDSGGFGIRTGGERRLRVLHLSTFDSSDGAARGALWLHRALRERGCDSTMVVGFKRSADTTILPLPNSLARFWAVARMKLDLLPLRRNGGHGPMASFWTVGWVPSRMGSLARRFAPDIVHLHWVGGGFLPIQALRQFRCPVVWTLRDMWAFTGGCHYTDGCNRYERGCGACPQLHSDQEGDLSRVIWNRKRRHWADVDLWVVPISDWLADCARSSALLHAAPIEVIPNGLDLGRFQPIDKVRARELCSLPADRPIVIYGAMRATRDPRKGFRELLAALEKFRHTAESENVLLVVFGDLKPGDLPDLGIESRYLGYIDDDRRLARLYAAADIAVMPSLQEAFGKTVIEAMACGTPVVAFDSGGPRDIIDHRVDGYLAEPFGADDLARGIGWCLAEVRAGSALGLRARAKVEAEFDIAVVADRYHALYRTALAASQRRAAAGAAVRLANA
ncbi:MAG: glycosyltransferase family 4 protein [Alphaproteobacteria bacterium]|nr:glycosyltransferase family 4 protein [Alphaproteobacteria bacterium]